MALFASLSGSIRSRAVPRARDGASARSPSKDETRGAQSQLPAMTPVVDRYLQHAYHSITKENKMVPLGDCSGPPLNCPWLETCLSFIHEGPTRWSHRSWGTAAAPLSIAQCLQQALSFTRDKQDGPTASQKPSVLTLVHFDNHFPLRPV
jgi:hypothetical protein